MNGVNTKIQATNDRLDLIIAAMGLQGDMLQVVQDIHLDTQSIDLKLLAIRDEQADIHLDTQSMDLKLLDMRNTLTFIYTQVLNLAPGTFDWAEVLGTPAGATDNILDWLAALMASTGIPTGDATTTILGRLSAIETLNYNYLPLIATNTGKCPCGASPPPEGNICAEPYISTGMALVPTALIPNFNSVTIAIWGNVPPSQLEYGTVFGTVSDNSSLVPASGQNWVGRSIFVESGADNFALQTLGTARYPTNEWVALDDQGTAEISVMVDPGASVRAYICPDNGGGGGGAWGGGGGGGTWGVPCYTWSTSEMVTVSTENGDSVIPDWSKYGLSAHNNPGHNNPVWVTGDWNGWNFVTSGPAVYHQVLSNGATGNTDTTGTFSAPAGDDITFISGSAFTLTLCPPE